VLREDEEVVELDEDGNPIEVLEAETSDEETPENNDSDVEPYNNEELE
jgi:hypothetical protein